MSKKCSILPVTIQAKLSAHLLRRAPMQKKNKKFLRKNAKSLTLISLADIREVYLYEAKDRSDRVCLVVH